MRQRQDREPSPAAGPGSRVAGQRGLQDFRYRAFISYSYEDQSWADWLIKALETYRVPGRLVDSETAAGRIPRRLTPIFRDRDEMASASDLGDTIREALADSASLIVICSPASANSHWVNEEIRAFQELGRGDRVLCLIVDGQPNASALPGQEYKECLAPTLRRAPVKDGELPEHAIEPAAADVRAGKDGKSTARLKLIAGLLGVGYDHLRRRDQQRRVRRMVAVMALALVVTAVTTTLAISAFVARQSAEAARQAAERRQKQAEDLVNFMLGDLNDKLGEVGRLDIMQSVDDKAMDYFASLPLADVTDQSLALRATALQKIGSIRLDQGHLDKALKSFQLALDINRRLLDKHPGNAERLADFGNSHTYIGLAYWHMADLSLAEREFRAANQALDRAIAADPGSPDIKQQLADVLNNLGEVLRLRNKPEQALAKYKQQTALYKQLLAADPDNPRYTSNFFVAMNNLASFEFGRGQLLRSVREFIDTRTMISNLHDRNPRDRSLEFYLMISNAKLANVLHATGRHKQAMHYIGRSIALGTTLVHVDASNSHWRMIRDAYNVWQAQWQREMHPESQASYRSLLALAASLAKLYRANPKDASTRRSYALAQLAVASAALDLGRRGTAGTFANQMLATLQPLPEPTPAHARTLRMACQAELLLSRLDPAQREAHAARALALIQPIARQSDNPRDLSPWVAALLASGHRDQALVVIKRLRAMGFQPRDFTTLLARRHIDSTPDPDFEARLDAILAPLRVPAGSAGGDTHSHAATTP